MIAGLSGKAMGALDWWWQRSFVWWGQFGDTASGAAQAAIKACSKEGGKNAFLQGITNKSLQGWVSWRALPGVGTAALVGSAMNPPTMKMPEKKKKKK